VDDPQSDPEALFRLLPSVDELLRGSGLSALVEKYPRAVLVQAARSILGSVRKDIAAGAHTQKSVLEVVYAMGDRVALEAQRSLSPTLVAVINATGVVLHTNLGRAPLSEAAIRTIVDVASGYSNLEFDLQSGSRGRRDRHAGPMLLRALGSIVGEPAEQIGERWDVAIVNNCAAATLLGLNSLAEGGEVLVSRGELVEIGGGFRIPEILKKAGVHLREVGTTNRTRLSDYAGAINANTRMILRVHQSNFRMQGFTERVELEDLVELGRSSGIFVFEDQGTGLMVSLDDLGVHGEPSLAESFRKAPDLIAASGDKLLGGPQCGILLGKSAVVERVRANPLFRALRVDKLTYAALEATLLSYMTHKEDEIPTVRMLRVPASELHRRCLAVRDAVATKDLEAIVVSTQSVIGGGTTAGSTLDSFAVSLRHELHTASALLAELRRQSPPLIARVQNDCVLLDLRAVPPAQDEVVIGIVRAVAPREWKR